MAKQDKSKLKDWFRTGKYPTQEQFWDWMDSYIHRDDQLRIGANFPELDGVLQQKVDKEVFKHHFENQNNPHFVTKQQVGLGLADNTADVDKPISAATQNALDLKVDKTAMTLHLKDDNNPHKVTKQQIGLGNVDNTSDIDKPISKATQTALHLKANHTHIHDVEALEGFDTDVTLAANSDEKIASQKAVKAYVDAVNVALQKRIVKLEKSQLIPGMIMVWKGSVDTIPVGWQLCEELKDKFILGAGADFAVGATGGARTHRLTVEEMPTHGHPIRNVLVLNAEGEGVFSSGDRTKSMFSTPSTDQTGGNQPHQNMPPYYALAYIEYVGYGDSAA